MIVSYCPSSTRMAITWRAVAERTLELSVPPMSRASGGEALSLGVSPLRDSQPGLGDETMSR